MVGVLSRHVNRFTQTAVFVSSMIVRLVSRDPVRSSPFPADTTPATSSSTRCVIGRVEERGFRRLEPHLATFEHSWGRTSRVAVAEVAITRRDARDVWGTKPVSSAQVPQVRLGACAAHRRCCVVFCRQRLTVTCQTPKQRQ